MVMHYARGPIGVRPGVKQLSGQGYASGQRRVRKLRLLTRTKLSAQGSGWMALWLGQVALWLGQVALWLGQVALWLG